MSSVLSTTSTTSSSGSSQSGRPLAVGDSIILTPWVHETYRGSPPAQINLDAWRGCAHGDLLEITPIGSAAPRGGFLFVVSEEKRTGLRRGKDPMQISIDDEIAKMFGFFRQRDVRVAKVDRDDYTAHYIEICFRDQYLGRSEMWRLGMGLEDTCVHTNQEVTCIKGIEAQIRGVFMKGKRVDTAYVTSWTKTIYRSLSARHTLLIQISRELWEFAEDGERFYEKLCHSFLPTLFTRWSKMGANHLLTVVLMSRVYYDNDELTFASEPLLQDKSGNFYKDLYKVIVDLEIMDEWQPAIRSLKQSLWDFQREILLSSPSMTPVDDLPVRLVGHISYAHEGNILEALNLALNPFERYHIDRDMARTGMSLSVVTPGTGRFEVEKELLRLTNERMTENGFVVDLICLAHQPLHVVPLFTYVSHIPSEKDKGITYRELNPLCYETPRDAPTLPSPQKQTYHMIPSWLYCSYWERSWDMPFRSDRFIPRCRMYEVQMLGLLEQDVSSIISIPLVDDTNASALRQGSKLTKEEARREQAADTFRRPRPAIAGTSLSDGFSSGSTISGHHRPAGRESAVVSYSETSCSALSQKPRRTTSQRTAIPSLYALNEEPYPLPRLYQDIRVYSPPAAHSTPAEVTGPSGEDIVKPGTSPSGVSIRSTNSGGGSDKSLLTLSRMKSAAPWALPSLLPQLAVPRTTIVTGTPSISQPDRRSRETVEKSTPVSAASSATVVQPAPYNHPPQPISIKGPHASRSRVPRSDDELYGDYFGGSRTSHSRSHEDSTVTIRHTDDSTPRYRYTQLASGLTLLNPANPTIAQITGVANDARRWKHSFPRPTFEHQMKWTSLCMPACLPLTVDTFPTTVELKRDFQTFSYDVVIMPDMESQFIRTKSKQHGHLPRLEDDIADQLIRVMAAFRLAQGYQFVVSNTSVKPRSTLSDPSRPLPRGPASFSNDPNADLKPGGASEVLKKIGEAPIFLTMGNQIHRFSYDKEEQLIQVRRYVRQKRHMDDFQYRCLIWHKHASGYVPSAASFKHPVENIGWNRMDMLLAGYEHQLSDTMRYWRARFVVLSSEKPPTLRASKSEYMTDEEIRLIGIDRLAHLFAATQWLKSGEKREEKAPVVVTGLDPMPALFDGDTMESLENWMSPMPADRRRKAEKSLQGASLATVARAMRDPEGRLPIKYHEWHHAQYPDSFKGSEFVSWLMREYKDVSTRSEAVEQGVRLESEGLFEHCRRAHGFHDGHYFYRLMEPYTLPSPPKRSRTWFKSPRVNRGGDTLDESASSKSGRHQKKTVVLTNSMTLDLDPMGNSDQAEVVVLHHDVLHNAKNAYHFELNWIGTTARYIDEMVQGWNRQISGHGLMTVEAYVEQISDVSKNSPFRSCVDIPLALAPPEIPELATRLPMGTNPELYFEGLLLRKLGYTLDIEPAARYPKEITVKYSYRRSEYNYPQYIHISGLSFVQIVGGLAGFKWLANGLVIANASSRLRQQNQYDYQAVSDESRLRPALAAEGMRQALQEFCSKKETLQAFYDEVIEALPPAGDTMSRISEDSNPD